MCSWHLRYAVYVIASHVMKKRLTSWQLYNNPSTNVAVLKALFFDKIQFYLTQESKRLISFSGFSLSFSIFSLEIGDAFPPAPQMNQIFCYICFVITYPPAHMQAIKHRGTESGFRGHSSALVHPQTMWGDFSSISSYLLKLKVRRRKPIVGNVSLFTLLSCHQRSAHR